MPKSAAAIREHFAYWDDIAVIHKGVRTVSTGHGFCGIGRKQLLMLLQERARELGIKLEFQTDIADPRPFMESHDLVIAADGLNSRVARDLRRPFRARHRHAQVQVRLARHAPEIRRRLHLHLREDRAWLGLGARLPVRSGHGDLHRRVQPGRPGTGSASAI